MDLSSLLAPYPEVSLAGPRDNEEILRFFRSVPMAGSSLQLRFERDPDFFRFLDYQSDHPCVFIGRNEQGITGVATMVIRDGYIDGMRVPVGYLGDLRTIPDRRTAVIWRKLYSQILLHSQDLPELKGCRHFLTAIIDENQQARAALVGTKRAEFEYRPLSRYRMVNILARLPWARREQAWTVGAPKDREELHKFLNAQNRKLAFGFAPDEWERRLARWDGLSLNDFVIARDGAGTIRGCFAAWSPSRAKRTVLERMPWAGRALCAALKPFLPRVPTEGLPLDILYLTHLHLDLALSEKERQGAFRAMLDALYRSGRPRGAHMVSFCDYDSHPLTAALGGYVTQSTPMTLYQVVHREHFNDDVLGAMPPGFEMSLV